MKSKLIIVAAALFIGTSAHAVDDKYRQKLERSGCTQVSELQGCDINKTKAENDKAGFGTAAPSAVASTYAGTWIAKNSQTNQTVATIHVDTNNKVTVRWCSRLVSSHTPSKVIRIFRTKAAGTIPMRIPKGRSVASNPACQAFRVASATLFVSALA